MFSVKIRTIYFWEIVSLEAHLISVFSLKKKNSEVEKNPKTKFQAVLR